MQVSSENPSFLYSAASDLSWGLRVVAVYGKTMVLYCVPPDIMTDMSKVTGTTLSPIEEVAEECSFSSWYNYWDFGNLKAGDRQWPIPLQGSVIEEVDGITDLCIQGSTTPTIWGFFADRTAKTWETSHGNTVDVLQKHVDCDGMVQGSIDKDGDWIMRDARRSIGHVYGNGGVSSKRGGIKFHGQQDIFNDDDGRKCSRVERFQPC